MTSAGGTLFTYDYSDQPVAVSGTSYVGGAVNGIFVYDGNSKRVKQQVNGATIYSVYDRSGALVTRDNITTGKITEYVAGPTGTFAKYDGSVVTYLHNDIVGSAVSGTNSAGTVTWRQKHTPFGEELNAVAANKDEIGFTGHIKDSDTGLNYMQQRYYDPLIGRFYSNDPVGFTASNPMMFNRYAYANNNPYKYVDPDGRVPFPLTPLDKGTGRTYQTDLTLEQQATGAAMVVGAALMLVPDPTDALLAGAVSKVALGRGQQVGRMINPDGSTKASDIKAKAESVGFQPTRSANGPLKMVDENGTARVTIKEGSARTPGSEGPHVELKDSSGQRVNPAGEPVTRNSPENHTPIIDDRK